MRLLHSADWHLGRLFHSRSLLEDQAYVLNSLLDVVRDTRPDVLLIAGDVYDRAVPPPEAVALLDQTLASVVLHLGVPVVLIAGNHDSAERLDFGSRFLRSSGLHVAGRVSAATPMLRLSDEYGDVVIYALPYADPAVVRDVYGDSEAHSHEHAMRLQVAAIKQAHDRAARSVLVGHAFVVGGAESESERPLSVGGSGAVSAALFDTFDYVALGHLHAPQTLAGGRIRYAGSPMKYSVSEADHHKSVSLVELGPKGSLCVEEIPLPTKRDLRVLQGSLAELLLFAEGDSRPGDYIYARLTDEGALLDPLARLRKRYPNVLAAERLVLSRSGELAASRHRMRQLDSVELFADFVKEVTGEGLDGARLAELQSVLARVGKEQSGS